MMLAARAPPHRTQRRAAAGTVAATQRRRSAAEDQVRSARQTARPRQGACPPLPPADRRARPPPAIRPLSRHRALPTPLLDTPQTVNVVTRAGHPGTAPHQHGRCAAHRPRHHLQCRRRRQAGRHARSSAASPRAATSSATASAIRAGTRVTCSTPIASKSTRARRPSRSAAARPAARSTPSPRLPTGAQLHRRHRHGHHRPRRTAPSSTPAARTDNVCRPHRGDVPGLRHAGPRQCLDQALGRRAVGHRSTSPSDQGDLQLHLSGRRERSRLRPSLSAAAGLQPADRRLTNVGYYGNGTPVTPVPMPRSNWFGVTNGPLARSSCRPRRTSSRPRSSTSSRNDVKIINATRYISVDRFARPTAPRSLGFGGQRRPRQRPRLSGRSDDDRPRSTSRRDRQHDARPTRPTWSRKFKTGSLQHTLRGRRSKLARETRDQQRARHCDRLASRPTSSAAPACFPVDQRRRRRRQRGDRQPDRTSSSEQRSRVYAIDQIKINEYFELLGCVPLRPLRRPSTTTSRSADTIAISSAATTC